jgi:RNA polymerase sigma-70 factor (ECF subfamily)
MLLWFSIPIAQDLPPVTELQRLIQRAQKRDKTAIGALYELYAQRIYRYVAFRTPTVADAEDITGNVFLKMLESLPTYREQGIPFEAWLYRIAAAKIADFYRRQRRRPQVELTETMTHDAPLPEETLEERQEFEMLRDALRGLTDEQQHILILRFIEHKSHQDVALLVGKSVSAVKSIQHRALTELASRLGSRNKARHYLRGGGND